MGKLRVKDEKLTLVDVAFDTEKDSDEVLENPEYQKLKGVN